MEPVKTFYRGQLVCLLSGSETMVVEQPAPDPDTYVCVWQNKAGVVQRKIFHAATLMLAPVTPPNNETQND